MGPVGNRLKRPKTWSKNEKLTITKKRYNLKTIHTFIIKCLRHEWGVKNIEFKKGLLSEELLGISIFDERLIFIACKMSKIRKQQVILHEIFHVFFKDADDVRKRVPVNQEEDPIERRCENSAINMLSWYNENPDYYNEFLGYVKMIPVSFLTIDERGLL